MALSQREWEGRNRPQADACENSVLAAAKLPEHRAGRLFIARLAERQAVAFCHRVRSQHDGRLSIRNGRWLIQVDRSCRIRILPRQESWLQPQLFAHGLRLAVRQFRNEAGRARFAANAALDILARRHNDELVARLGQQLASAGRVAGQDEKVGTGGYSLGTGDWGLDVWHGRIVAGTLSSCRDHSIRLDTNRPSVQPPKPPASSSRHARRPV